MKIALITEIFPPIHGGVPEVVRLLATNLHASGHEVLVITNQKNAATEAHDKQYGFTVARIRSLPNPFDNDYHVSLFAKKQVDMALTEFQPDCLHFHTPWGHAHTVSYGWARRNHVPVVATNHIMKENATANLRGMGVFAGVVSRLIYRSLIKRLNLCDYVTAPTSTALNMIRRDLFVPAQAVTNGIDTGFYNPKLARPYDFSTPYVAYVGRLSPEKRLDIILDALAIARASQPDIHLIIAGKGPARLELEQQVARLGLEESVTMLGYIDDETKRDLLRGARFTVNAGPAELQCIAALESLALNTPIMVADQAATVELVAANQNGLLFCYPSIEDAADKMVTLWRNPIEVNTLDRHARRFVQAQHSHQHARDLYVELYTRAAGDSN